MKIYKRKILEKLCIYRVFICQSRIEKGLGWKGKVWFVLKSSYHINHIILKINCSQMMIRGPILIIFIVFIIQVSSNFEMFDWNQHSSFKVVQ